jgi:putative hydrolase of HD superfamily
VKYLFEIGLLGKLKNTCGYVTDVENPETIAQQAHRAAIAAHFIAKLEKANAPKARLMCLLYHSPEIRLSDTNKMEERYINVKKAKKEAFKEQISNLPADLKKEFSNLFEDVHSKKSKEAIIAEDANRIAFALREKEYLMRGYSSMKDELKGISRMLKTKTAKAMLKEIKKAKPEGWWREKKDVTFLG